MTAVVGGLLTALPFWSLLQGPCIFWDTSGSSLCSWARPGTAVLPGIQDHAWQMWWQDAGGMHE